MKRDLQLLFVVLLLIGSVFLPLLARSGEIAPASDNSQESLGNQTIKSLYAQESKLVANETEESSGSPVANMLVNSTLPQEPQALVLSSVTALPLAKNLTLSDCYAFALKQSEVIAINAELIKEAEAHFIQSLGTALPQVSFTSSHTNQDSSQAFSSANNNGGFENKFVFKQTLFSGFKEFAGMAGSKLEKQQRFYEKQRAQHLLFVDVSDAFYLLLEKEEDLETVRDIQQALTERISDLKKREDIGRSRHSEVVNAQSQLYNVEAEMELVKSQETIAYELLSFLIGKETFAIADAADTPNALQAEVNYTAKSDLRPDVRAAEYAWGVAKKEVVVAKSDLFPTVTMEGDYFQHRDAAPLDKKWSTVLKVDVPIFEGTTTFGAIKSANTQARISELEFKQAKRLALQDVHDSYTRALVAISRTQALDKAFKSADENYILQKQDYQNSLVSNLDVLAAIQNLGNTRRTYIQAFYEKKRFYWQLQAAIGAISQE